MRLLLLLLTLALIGQVLLADENVSTRRKNKRQKFKEQLAKARGDKGNSTGEELEHLHRALKKRGDRFKKKFNLTEEERQSLQQRLKKIGRAEFKKENRSRIEEINVDEEIDDYLFEGDIVLTEEQIEAIEKEDVEEGREKRQAFRDSSYPATIWSGPIPYTLDSSLSSKALTMIAKGIAFWEANTCVSFAKNGAGANSLRFFSGSGCYSYVGRIASWSSQEISIGTGCESIRTTTHEIGHALGFFHAQSRHDRDGYVTINLANVQTDKEHNFRKEDSSRNYNYEQPYEYGSVMHYSPFSFAVNYSIPTIVPKDSEYLYTMGSGREPSFYDVYMMNKHYSCLSVCNSYSTVCYNGGYKDIKNCAICKCPAGYGGNDCSQRKPGCGTTLTATTTYQNYTAAKLGDGTYVLKDDFTECNYWITAPAGKRIQIIINDVGYYCSDGCYYGGVEFKMVADQMLTGYRYCCTSHKGKTLTSVGNVVPIIVFNRYYSSGFSISYRYIDGGVTTTTSRVTPTTTKATTTTTKPTTTTTKATTTTTKATTTTSVPTGSWTYYNQTKSYYKRLGTPLSTWNGAESRCVAEGGHLVSIHSEAENTFVRSLFYSSEHYSIGLRCTNKTCRWTDNTPLDYTKWWSTYPTASTQCTMMCPADKTWEDWGCTAVFAAICKRPAASEWTYFAATNAWYKEFTGTWLTMSAAESQCKAEGSHLVSIHSAVENQYVRDFFSVSEHHRIGLSCVNKVCTWLDGTPLDYTKWWSSYPTTSTQCVVMCPADQTWEGPSCATNYPFICKKPGLTTTTTTTTITPPTWTYYSTTKAYYKAFINNLNWTKAEDACVAEGGHLVSIHSLAENQFVRALLPTYNHYQIGISCNNLVCKWIDGTAWDFTKWWSSYPTTSTKCGVMCPADQTWEDYGCSTLYPYVCKKPATTEWTYNSATGAFYKELLVPYSNWATSSSRCQAEGGQLASIHSEAENQFVRSMFSNSLHHHIGLNCTNLVCGWTDKSALDYKKWWSSYPTSSTQCVVMCPADQTWEDYGCTGLYPAICKKSSNAGWTYFTETNSWYKVIDSYWNSTTAEEKCKAIGAHLVSIQSEAENTFVRALFSISTHYHIGLRCTNKVCSWLDGKPVSYTKWWSTYPSTSTVCVAMCPTDKTWEDHGCTVTLPSICKRPN